MTRTRRILHHCRKDLQALAPLLGIWLALLLVVTVVSPFIGWTRSPALILYALVPGLVTIMGLVFMVVVQFQDPVADTEAAWRSRPLRPGELLAAKLLFALPIVALLVGQDVVSLAANGAGWASLLSIPRNLLWFVPVALGFFAIGSLARSGRDLLVVSAVMLALAVLLFTIAGRVSESSGGRLADAALVRDEALRASRMIVGSVLASIAALAAAAHQFRTRRTLLSGGILAGGILAVVLAATFWPWRFFATAPGRMIAAADSIALEAITLSVRPESVAVQPIETVDRFERTIARNFRVSAIVSLDHRPPGTGIHFARIESHFTLPDGSTITSAGSNPIPRDDAAAAIAETENLDRVDHDTARIDGQPAAPTASRTFDLHVATLTEEEFNRIRDTPVDLVVTAEVALSQWRLTGEIPLVQDRKMTIGSQAIVVTDVEVGEATRSGTGPDGDYRFVDPQWFKVSLHARRPGWAYEPGDPVWRILNSERSFPEGAFLLVNRKSGQLLGTNSWGGGSTPRAMSLVDDFDYSLTFHLPPGPSGNAPSPWSAAWLEEASLANARKAPIGTTVRTVELSRLRLGELAR